MDNVLTALNKVISDVILLAEEGHGIDGGHHKQWCLEQILEVLGRELPEEEKDGMPG
jgi:hypothetical protein